MAKKEIPIFLSEYNILKGINQKMKEISDLYTINNSQIFIHGLIPFVEKYASINTELSYYNQLSILPNELFQFTKLAKKTTLDSQMLEDKIILSDTSEIKEGKDHAQDISLYKIPDADDYISKIILPKYYQHSDLLLIDNLSYTELSSDTVETLCNGGLVNLQADNCDMTITRNLFTTLKKTDKLSCAIILNGDPEMPNKFYAKFKEESEYITIYTLGAFITL